MANIESVKSNYSQLQLCSGENIISLITNKSKKATDIKSSMNDIIISAKQPYVYDSNMEDQRRPLKKLHLQLVKKPSVYSSTKEDRSSLLKKLRLELVHQPSVYDSSMEDQSILLKKFRLELVVSSTSPEIALKALSSPCFSPMNYKSDDDELIEIFLACMKFMMIKIPEGSVQGIWEEFLRNTINYSLNFSKVVQDNFRHIRLFPMFGLA